MTRLACVAVVKNEERHIAEWIAWQYAIGFDTVILLDNASTDATVDRALGFAEARDIRILDWHVTDPDYQSRAYSHAVALFGDEFDWMAFFDTDEFLVLDEGLALKSCLEARSEAAGVGVAWAIFGSSGHREIPAGLVVESYLRRSDAGFGPNRHIKSIIRPGAVTACRNPHVFLLTGPYEDLIGRALLLDERGLLVAAPDYEGGKLHHYFTKSWSDWQRKLERGYHDTERLQEMFHDYDRNEIFDDQAARFLKASPYNALKCAVVLVVKDEVDDILCWLAWYHILGVHACIVFDDGSTDGTWELLQKAAGLQDIRLHKSAGPADVTFQKRQKSSYQFALEHYKNEFAWMGFFDSDEYLLIKGDNPNIPAFLDQFPDADAVAVNWCNYGSSEHLLKPDALPVEAYTWHASEQELVNRHVKTFVRPGKIGTSWINVHCFDIPQDKYFHCNGKPIEWSETPGITRDDADWLVAKLMHYQCKSMEQFFDRIRKRPDFAAVKGLWRKSDYHDVEDRAAHSYAPAVKDWIRCLASVSTDKQGHKTTKYADPLRRPKPVQVENDFIAQGFVAGWEWAHLGNRLSSYANMFALSQRTGVVTLFPQILDTANLFDFGDHPYFHIHPDVSLVDGAGLTRLLAYMREIFEGGYAAYLQRVRAITIDDLAAMKTASNVVVFIQPSNGFLDALEHESVITEFCRRGNGIIFAGAYWLQYQDMRLLQPYADTLRYRLRMNRPDGAGDRAVNMRQQPGDLLRIGIHMRRRDDYAAWYGGQYHFSLEQYAAVTKAISVSLGASTHCFYLCSDQAVDLSLFAGLPVHHEISVLEDDFVALSNCHYIVGPPSTFGTWSAFIGGAKRLILTSQRMADLDHWENPLADAVQIIFPTGSYIPDDPAARPI